MTRPAASRTVTWIANGATVLLVTQLAVSGVLLILRPTIMTDVVRHLGNSEGQADLTSIGADGYQIAFGGADLACSGRRQPSDGRASPPFSPATGRPSTSATATTLYAPP